MEMDTGNHGHQYEHGYGKKILGCIHMDVY